MNLTVEIGCVRAVGNEMMRHRRARTIVNYHLYVHRDAVL